MMLAPGAQLPPGTSTRCTVADTSPRSNSPLTPCTHTTCMHHGKWLVLLSAIFVHHAKPVCLSFCLSFALRHMPRKEANVSTARRLTHMTRSCQTRARKVLASLHMRVEKMLAIASARGTVVLSESSRVDRFVSTHICQELGGESSVR